MARTSGQGRPLPMNDDVRIAALRAASKLALGVTFVGCAAPSIEAEPATTAAAEDGEPATAADDLRGAKKKKPVAKADAGPTACKDAGAEPVSCKALLTATFADPAWADFHTYRSEPAPVPAHVPAVESCCQEELTAAERTFDGSHRWECCNLLGGGTSTGPNTPMFCTPWGPPVPPAMRGRRLLEVV